MEEIKKAREVKVIELEKEVGDGTLESPFMLVSEYWTVEGKKIGEIPNGGILLHGCCGMVGKL